MTIEITLHNEIQRHAFISAGLCLAESMFEKKVKVSDLPQSLDSLARFLKPDYDRNQSPLLVFFSPRAAALLLSLPNQYWLWRVAQDAVPYAYWDNHNEQISLKALRLAIRNIGDGERRRYKADEAIADLSNEEVGDRLERGILLLNAQCTVVQNWIFYQPERSPANWLLT